MEAKSPCRQADEIVDADVALIFNRAAMEKTNPSCPLAVAGEEEEEINPQYQKTCHEETLTLDNSIY